MALRLLLLLLAATPVLAQAQGEGGEDLQPARGWDGAGGTGSLWRVRVRARFAVRSCVAGCAHARARLLCSTGLQRLLGVGACACVHVAGGAAAPRD